MHRRKSNLLLQSQLSYVESLQTEALRTQKAEKSFSASAFVPNLILPSIRLTWIVVVIYGLYLLLSSWLPRN